MFRTFPIFSQVTIRELIVWPGRVRRLQSDQKIHRTKTKPLVDDHLEIFRN